ncbi:ABC transporter permease [Lachnotalea sp. AF33-28]|uniref:ABC transporter permease n=1 Tax=Lachnotalea sp. AF33-28 TaxID=2292046 RepID=UPI001FAAC1FA|nr:ABC transporter permease subunit [Lachnotalea sp. AF33-28]
MKKAKTTAVAMSAADRKKWKRFKLFLFILPGVLLVLIFSYLPLWGWSFAFFQYRPGRALFDCDFVGWDNFTQLFGNAVMRKNLIRVLKNTFGIHFLGYVFSPLPMLFAVLLSEIRSKKFQKLVQTFTTLPHFISWVIMFSLALSMFGSNGLFNTVLKDLGISANVNFLNSDKHVWLAQVLLQQWKGLGWSAIIYFAAIAGLDQELYEAAMVDGAGRWAKIRYITIPLLIPTYFVLLIMSIGNFLNTGVDQYLAFGNALNKEYIEVLDLYVYNLGIGSGQISFSVAVGVMKSLVAVVLFATANFASKKIRGTSVF